MKKIINETQSLCPECLKKIPARHIEDDGKVFLEKERKSSMCLYGKERIAKTTDCGISGIIAGGSLSS